MLLFDFRCAIICSSAGDTATNQGNRDMGYFKTRDPMWHVDAKTMLREGKTVAEIADRLYKSKGAVYAVKKKYELHLEKQRARFNAA